MNPKFRINVIGLAVALVSVLAGYGLGEPPISSGTAPSAQVEALDLGPVAAGEAAAASRDALIRHLAMPYVSFAALTPRQES